MFKDLYGIAKEGVDLTMVISAVGERLTVSVLPKAMEKDSDKGNGSAELKINKPFVVSGTPEELNADFCNQLKMFKESTVGLVSNIAMYQDMVAKEKGSVERKAKKTAKVVKPGADENKKSDTPAQGTLF